MRNPLDKSGAVVYIVVHTAKDIDGDSTLQGKAEASRGRCEPGAVKCRRKIPPKSCR